MRLCSLGVLLLLASPSWGAIAFSHSGVNAAVASSVAVTVTINAGDAVVVGIGCDASAARTVSSVVDSASNSGYAQLNFNNATVGSQGFAWGATNVASAATSVTVTMSGSCGTGGGLTVAVLTYTGVGTNGFGVNHVNTGANVTSITDSITTQDANNFVVTMFDNHKRTSGTITCSASAGNLRTQTAAALDVECANDNTAATASSVTNTDTTSAAVNFTAVSVELRSTNAAGGGANHTLLTLGVGE